MCACAAVPGVPFLVLLAAVAIAKTVAAAYDDSTCYRYPGSSEVLRLFRETTPCPSTGSTQGGCPEIANHFIPLCLGGPDTVANLWWEERERSYIKDEIEQSACHAHARHRTARL
jgi:hypothetical protein